MNEAYRVKLEQAIAWLGTRWVLHRSNQILKGNYETPTTRADIRKTFKRVKKVLRKMEPSVTL